MLDIRTSPPVFMTLDDHRRLETLLETLAPSPLWERLGEEVDRAVIVTGGFAAGFVSLGSLAEIVNEQSGRVRRVRLVMPEAAKGDPEALSVLSPAGVALVGLREGDAFDWEDEEGRAQSIRVLRIITEEGGDDHTPFAA